MPFKIFILREKITAENLSLNDRFKDFECQIEKLTIENSKLKVENRKRTCQYKKCKNNGNVNKNGTNHLNHFTLENCPLWKKVLILNILIKNF